MKKIILFFKIIFYLISPSVFYNLVFYNLYDAKIEKIFKTDVINALNYSLKFDLNIVSFDEKIFEVTLNDLLKKSFNNYFDNANLQFGYLFDEVTLKEVKVCLNYQKNYYKNKKEIQFSLTYHL